MPWSSTRGALSGGLLVLVATGAACSAELASKRSSASSSRSTPPATIESPAVTPTHTSVETTYRVGERVAAGELAASMLAAMDGKTVRISVTGADPVVCRSESSGGAWAVLQPAVGVAEVRVIRQDAYIRDHGRWTTVDLTDEGRTLETQAMADALNRTLDLLPGDCRWNERLAAIDPAGTAVVRKVTREGATLTIPTDPESQGDKSSESPRTYAQATWVVGRDGAPRLYQAADGRRVFTFSLSTDPIEAPPAEGTQAG